MKKLFLMLAGAMMICAAHAQVLEEGESALVYYSPKTCIELDFTYTVESFEPGIYAQYAEEMLGATEVILERKKVYRLEDVKIGTRTETDYNRPHKVDTESGIPMLLNINDKGILTGYNVESAAKKTVNSKNESSTNPAGKSRNNRSRLAPLPEEVLKAATPQAQAFEVAKQIFHIRETRMYLLNGEVEHAPADGKAMELVLSEMDKQERELTELFIGKKGKKTGHKHVGYSNICRQGTTKEDYVIKEKFYFSEENGFTNGDNIDADIITVLIDLKTSEYKAPEADKKKSKKGGELSQIAYNLPGSAYIKVYSKNDNLLRERIVPMAQLGIDVPLPKSLFTDKELPKIVFNEKTGNIVSISK